MALKDKLMTLEDFKAVRDVDVASNSAQFTEIKADLDVLVPTDLVKGTTYTNNKYVRYNTGDLVNASGSSNATDYIDISEFDEIVYTRISSPSTSTQSGIAFYDANKEYISGVRAILNQPVMSYVMSSVVVPEGAKYVRLTAHQSLGGEASCYDADEYNAKLASRVATAETNITNIQSKQVDLNDKMDDIAGDGYTPLPLDKWESGGWSTFNSSDNRAYRAHYTETLVFPYHVYVLAEVGFKIDGYRENGTAFGADTAILVPANTKFKIFARRYTENTSETADVSELAQAVKLSTAVAPISVYEPTFTDVSMFERMGISGDSYSAGGGIISGITALTWGKNLQRQSGVQVDIYAKSGDSIVDWVQNQTKGLPALLAGSECGLYWFQHGINGTSSAAAIGTAADMEADPKPATFYGQYAYAIEAVKAAFPKARIVVATITGTDWGLAQSTYSAANTAIKAIAEYEEVPCVDISEDEFFRSKFYQDYNKSSHPTAMQAAGMAMAYRRLISKCIQANPNYFINYGT